MLVTPLLGPRVVKANKLTTTSATVIATAADKITYIIDSIRVADINGGSTLDLWVTDGTTSYYIVKGSTVAAAGTYEVKDHHIPLESGWSLRAQAGTANRLDVTAVLIQLTQTR